MLLKNQLSHLHKRTRCTWITLLEQSNLLDEIAMQHLAAIWLTTLQTFNKITTSKITIDKLMNLTKIKVQNSSNKKNKTLKVYDRFICSEKMLFRP